MPPWMTTPRLSARCCRCRHRRRPLVVALALHQPYSEVAPTASPCERRRPAATEMAMRSNDTAVFQPCARLFSRYDLAEDCWACICCRVGFWVCERVGNERTGPYIPPLPDDPRQQQPQLPPPKPLPLLSTHQGHAVGDQHPDCVHDDDERGRGRGARVGVGERPDQERNEEDSQVLLRVVQRPVDQSDGAAPREEHGGPESGVRWDSGWV